jgi:hypothetical protein
MRIGTKRGIMALLPWALAPTQVLAQVNQPPKDPRGVLAAFLEVDSRGERLTASGWDKSFAFFAKPTRRPHDRAVEVIIDQRIDDPLSPRGDGKVEATVFCSALGQLDSLGRFTSVVFPYLVSAVGYRGVMTGPTQMGRVYDLVRSDTHWEFTGPASKQLREVKGAPEWRIDGFVDEPWITVDVAIRYLTKLRDESGSSVIKRNADRSIATLRRLKATPRAQSSK